MRANASGITRERKQLSRSGFRHHVANTRARSSMQIPKFSTRSLGDLQVGLWETTLIFRDPMLNFYFKYVYSIEKLVLFRTTQTRSFCLVPFRSFKGFPEIPGFGSLSLHQPKAGLERGN
jgi:hypothetical protein